METYDIVFMVAAGLGMVAACVGLKWWIDHLQRQTDWIENYVPLGDNARNARLEAAMRDAEQGFNVCATCGVENVKYRIFCVLCGSPVEEIDSGHDQPTAVTREVVTREPRPMVEHTQRQRRARTRREWTRVFEDDGKIKWRRSTDDPKDDCVRRAYIVEFSREDAVIVQIEKAVDGEEIEQGDGLTPNEPAPEDHIELQSPATLNKELQDDTARCTLNTVEATTSRPVVSGLGSRRSPLDVKDVIVMSSQPFPERLAAFVTHTTLLQASYGTLSLKIERSNLLEDSISLLAAIPPQLSASSVRLRFLEEEGIDAGGVYREWFLLVNEAIVAAEAGIFTCVDPQEQTFYLNCHSRELLGESHLLSFLAVGRLLGRALLEGNLTGFHLAQPLLKIILGRPLSFDDLEFYDPEVYKSLKWLVDNDGVDALDLSFSVTEQLPSGEMRTIDLVPNGSGVPVTDANKHEFIDCKLRYLLLESVSDQLFAFLKGIYQVIPEELFMLFDAEELDYVLSGSDVIDVDDWEAHTKFTADLIDHPVRQWFWEIVRAMPNESRSRLLQFATGASRVPLAGFAALTSYDGRLCPFTLKGVALKKESYYIHSHACFNRLDLPRYKTKEQLELMLIGVLDTQIRGFTIA